MKEKRERKCVRGRDGEGVRERGGMGEVESGVEVVWQRIRGGGWVGEDRMGCWLRKLNNKSLENKSE